MFTLPFDRLSLVVAVVTQICLEELTQICFDEFSPFSDRFFVVCFSFFELLEVIRMHSDRYGHIPIHPEAI